ncbi:hydroxymethylglutaryl-CoA synthase [Weissella sagaensis]|jgi:hydroxymethylglutaryl-CoA synthase|uniref:Hydroxymethylglutaryl-CoA synthase n=1 Tax=Weissella sagaensis TaxID=2559928 RepID=A0ABW1RTE0_9LACO|nr:hydroxymethylglutaryl-CoA synthase [Weissella sagaensis]KAA8431781.1 hydroxymethylglutaryl-CoA synthase [Weissella paramesenteroides]KAA8437905.1 hydroxymethylglutaryl-CoA synthase [Weissella paramesenteroides]QDJ59055.1 hydroxymethylglutaryl-CoA synthase [Weissella hellenica]UEG67199.1 hydroxymethylglutaryl-CoA synthase [Weissella hellenica]
MTVIGIDKMSFFSPQQYIDMVELANARGEEPDKYLIGIGQTQQAVIPPTQDVVTMAANAADEMLTASDRKAITMILFATESGIDNSKSGAVYLQRLLGINPYARTIELKQACYAGTFALMQARDYVTLHPTEKVLVIASDIARYGLKTSGEVTQGGGAVAMLVSANPAIAQINQDSQYLSRDVMDFWRPIYADTARVDGKYSANIYQDFFKAIWTRYKQKTGLDINNFQALAFHLPFTKMGLKALRDVLPEASETQQTNLMREFEASRVYNKRIGNLYTGSLYLSLYSLLDNSKTLKAGDHVGMFSYGSGAEGEFYSLTLRPHFKAGLINGQLEELLANRKQITIAEYETIFDNQLSGPLDRQLDTQQDTAKFVLSGLKNEQRQYICH